MADKVAEMLTIADRLVDKFPTPTNTSPPPPPTPTSSQAPTVTNSPPPTATNSPPPTATNSPPPTATNSPLPTATNTAPTPTNTIATPTNTAPTPTGTQPTPTNTRFTPTNTRPTPTNTRITPTPTNTQPTPTPTLTPTPFDAPDKALLYSIERDFFTFATGLTKEGDALIGGTLSPIAGGRYAALLRAFLADPHAEGRRLGLDALDAISIERGVLTRAFFSVERPFRVTRPGHPLFGSIVEHGDLLSRSGIVMPNSALLMPFDPVVPVDVRELGLDAVDVEGITANEYDAWTADFYNSGGTTLPPSSITTDARIYFSFEEINFSTTTGAGASTPPGTGVPISADDVLVHDLATGTGDVFRSGADGIPASAPNILDPFDPPGVFLENLGLDAIDMPNHPAESNEAGETGPIAGFRDSVLFSTSLDEVLLPVRFRHGDLLINEPLVSKLLIPNEGLTGRPRRFDLGLDGVDCLGDVETRPHPRRPFCRPIFIVTNVSSPNGGPVNPLVIRIIAALGCEIDGTIRIVFRYSSFALTRFVVPVIAGPNFAITSTGPKIEDKGIGMTTDAVELVRTGPGEEGEIVCEFGFMPGLPSAGGDMVEWVEISADGGSNVADNVGDSLVNTSDLPSKPTLLLPTSILSDSIEAAWVPNDLIEGVSEYQVTVRENGQPVASATVPSGTPAVVLDGLTPGTDYTLELVAVNAQGSSAPCTLDFTTRFDRMASQSNAILERLSRDWNPNGDAGSDDLQSLAPSPVDIDLNGRVNNDDALMILMDHLEN